MERTTTPTGPLEDAHIPVREDEHLEDGREGEVEVVGPGLAAGVADATILRWACTWPRTAQVMSSLQASEVHV